MSCVISKANIQLYFVNVSVQRRKAVIAMQCPLIESKHKADVFHFSLYLHLFIGSKHKDGVPWMYCIFGCIVFLDELVIIGLGIRQGFAGGGITGRI